MAHRLSDESRARVAKSSAGRSRRPRNRVYPRQGTSASDTPESTSDAASSTSDSSPTTPTTNPPSSTPPPTSRSTSDAVSTTPSSSSDSPTTPNSISTPPASTTPGPSSSAVESSSNPPSSETQTVSSPATTTTPPPVSTSAQETTTTPIESDTTVPVSSPTNRVVTSDSVIFSSASDVQVSVTTTNSLGQTTIGIPPVFTTTYTSTSNGIPLTITAVVSQATTLNTDGGGSTSPFFKNKGAVAGVFIVVGIAGAAIILFGVFTYLRRRKVRRLTREAAIAATLGSGRTPFVDDDDADAYASGPSGGNSTEMGYHSASDTRPVYGSYPAAYGAGSAYGYGPDPFYGNPPAGNSFNASPPGSIDHHGPPLTNPQGLLLPAPTSYGGAPGGPNLPPTTPLLAKGNPTTMPPAAVPASPPNVYTNANVPKGFEYDYSNYVPPSAVDGGAGRGLSPSPTSPTSPTFSKRSSLPLPPPGAAAPSYTALAAAAGLVSDPSEPPTTNIPPSAYQGTASNKARRISNTPSFASSASRYSVDAPGGDAVADQSQTLALPTYSAANVSKSQSGHSFNASSSNQSHGRPPTPGAEVFLGGDRGGLVRSSSGGSDWRAGGRPETPLIDHRLDPDTVLAAKGRSPGNRLSDYSTPSEESLGSLQDHEDYSRRVLQVTNPS